MAIIQTSNRAEQALALIANLNDEQFASLEAVLKEAASDENARVQVSSSGEAQLTREEGLILLKAFNGPTSEPSTRMLEAVANYKRIMSETL